MTQEETINALTRLRHDILSKATSIDEIMKILRLYYPTETRVVITKDFWKVERTENFQTKVQQRMEYLWDKLPDSHKVENGDCTPEEWKTLGAYMELEMNFDKNSEEEQNEQKPWKVGANAYFIPGQKPTAKINGEPISTENHTVNIGDDETEVQKAYREGKNAGRKEDTAPVRFEEEDGEKYPVVDYKLMGRKPWEWSEEDERMLRRCIKSVESSKNFVETQTFKEAKDKEKEWLISLPERFNLRDLARKEIE